MRDRAELRFQPRFLSQDLQRKRIEAFPQRCYSQSFKTDVLEHLTPTCITYSSVTMVQIPTTERRRPSLLLTHSFGEISVEHFRESMLAAVAPAMSGSLHYSCSHDGRQDVARKQGLLYQRTITNDPLLTAGPHLRKALTAFKLVPKVGDRAFKYEPAGDISDRDSAVRHGHNPFPTEACALW